MEIYKEIQDLIREQRSEIRDQRSENLEKRENEGLRLASLVGLVAGSCVFGSELVISGGCRSLRHDKLGQINDRLP